MSKSDQKKDRKLNYRFTTSRFFKDVTLQFSLTNCNLQELKAAFNRYTADLAGSEHYKVVSYE